MVEKVFWTEDTLVLTGICFWIFFLQDCLSKEKAEWSRERTMQQEHISEQGFSFAAASGQGIASITSTTSWPSSSPPSPSPTSAQSSRSGDKSRNCFPLRILMIPRNKSLLFNKLYLPSIILFFQKLDRSHFKLFPLFFCWLFLAILGNQLFFFK